MERRREAGRVAWQMDWPTWPRVLVPTSQAPHEVRPSSAWKVLTGQGVHSLEPSLAEK